MCKSESHIFWCLLFETLSSWRSLTLRRESDNWYALILKSRFDSTAKLINYYTVEATDELHTQVQVLKKAYEQNSAMWWLWTSLQLKVLGPFLVDGLRDLNWRVIQGTCNFEDFCDCSEKNAVCTINVKWRCMKSGEVRRNECWLRKLFLGAN